MKQFRHKDIIALKDLTKDEIELLIETAENMREINSREIKKVPTLRGRTIINLFYEASTRTRTSFEIAGKRLSADTVNITHFVQLGHQGGDSCRYRPESPGHEAGHYRHAPCRFRFPLLSLEKDAELFDHQCR